MAPLSEQVPCPTGALGWGMHLGRWQASPVGSCPVSVGSFLEEQGVGCRGQRVHFPAGVARRQRPLDALGWRRAGSSREALAPCHLWVPARSSPWQGICFIRTSRPENAIIYNNNEDFQIGQAKVGAFPTPSETLLRAQAWTCPSQTPSHLTGPCGTPRWYRGTRMTR